MVESLLWYPSMVVSGLKTVSGGFKRNVLKEIRLPIQLFKTEFFKSFFSEQAIKKFTHQTSFFKHSVQE